MRWYLIPINPEPWAVGPLDIGRRNGKVYPKMGQNRQLAAYQEAVRESITSGPSGPPPTKHPAERNVSLTFYFWRQLDSPDITSSSRRAQKHQADLTNLIKGTEDALQGILFDNDRQVTHSEGYIVEQTPTTTGKVIVCCMPENRELKNVAVYKIPQWVFALATAPEPDNSSWVDDTEKGSVPF